MKNKFIKEALELKPDASTYEHMIANSLYDSAPPIDRVKSEKPYPNITVSYHEFLSTLSEKESDMLAISEYFIDCFDVLHNKIMLGFDITDDQKYNLLDFITLLEKYNLTHLLKISEKRLTNIKNTL